MKAMVMRNKALAVEDIPVPKPGPGQVLARIRACGICGSDLHAARFWGEMQATSQQSGRRNPFPNRDASAPIVMGHEFVAEIVEAGEGADQWTPGMRVTSMPILFTQEPPGFTSIGYSPDYNGGYAEYVLLSSRLLLKVADNVSDTVAATTEPCAVGLHAVREAGLKGSEPVLVMGAGPIGLMTLLWLKKEGVKYVAVSDPSPERRALAEQIGADAVFDPNAVFLADALMDDIEKLQQQASGDGTVSYGGPGQGGSPTVVFECVGVPGTLQQAMQLVAIRGTVVVVGVCMQEDKITPMTGINKQLTLKFVLGYTGPEYAEALQAFADGELDTSPLVTRTISIDELPDTFNALADPKDCKVIVVP